MRRSVVLAAGLALPVAAAPRAGADWPSVPGPITVYRKSNPTGSGHVMHVWRGGSYGQM